MLLIIFFSEYIYLSQPHVGAQAEFQPAEQFTQALSLDPLLWSAYEELCI